MGFALIVIATVSCGRADDQPSLDRKLDRKLETMAPPPHVVAPRPDDDVTRGEHADDTGDRETAVRYYKQACDAKLVGGCGHLAVMLHLGLGVAQDGPRAEKLASAACDSKDGYGCFALAVIRDDTHAAASLVVDLYGRACDLGIWRACFNLGQMFSNGGSGVTREQAAAFYQRACDLGRDPTSCALAPRTR